MQLVRRSPAAGEQEAEHRMVWISDRKEEKSADRFPDNQKERLDYLLHEFKEDSVQYRNLETGEDYDEKRKYLRSLMNIRMPGPMDENVVRA